MTDQEIVALLNHDMTMEHQAIVQYLLAAWAIGGEVGSSIEGIARDEMRHFKWFAHAVVSLGGDPTVGRAPIERGTDPAALVRTNASAEDMAVVTYRQHREAIPYQNIKKLLDRIISDEQHHAGKFRAMLPKVEGMPAPQYHEPTTDKEKILYRYLEEDVSGEYSAILRYLHQSFVVKDGWLSKALEDRAIDEMKHLGWMAEEKSEAGGEPGMSPDPITLTADLREIFTNDVKLEQEAEARYQRHIDGYDDPDLQQLWEFIKFQEQHHTDEFQTRLLEQTEREAAAQAQVDQTPQKPASTVGSLYRVPQK